MDGQGSILARSNGERATAEVTVEGVTLDQRLGSPDGVDTAMWVDVEGASSSVLGGGPGLLADTQVLVIEVEERREWDGQPWLRAEVIDFLDMHGLVPVARDRQSRFQFNIVFVRASRRSDPDVVRAVERWRSSL